MECSICLDPIKNLKDNVKLRCSHEFHFECIHRVKTKKCPLCRGLITDEPICEGHQSVFFYSTTIKKNGECITCSKKSFRSILKDFIHK